MHVDIVKALHIHLCIYMSTYLSKIRSLQSLLVPDFYEWMTTGSVVST